MQLLLLPASTKICHKSRTNWRERERKKNVIIRWHNCTNFFTEKREKTNFRSTKLEKSHRDIRCGTKPEGEAFDRVSRMKTNGPGSAPGRAHLPVSMDLGRVSPLNPHPSARENTARLMIRLTRTGERGGGEGGESGVSLRAATAAAKEETPTAGIALLLFTLPRVLCLTQNCIACQSSRPGKRHLAPLPPLLSLFLAKEPYPRWRILPRVARRTNDFVTSCSRLLYLYFSARRRAEFEFSPSSVSTFSIVVEIGIGNEILMNQPFDLSPFLLPFR